MPKWTNRHNIDPAITQAVMSDDYELVGDISVTGLIRPPQIAALESQYGEQVEQDVSDGLWRLLGQSMHQVLQAGHVSGAIQEHTLTTEVKGWKVSGTCDIYYEDSNILKDFKVTSVWSYIFGGRAEWQAQVNLYAYLAEQNGIQVDELKIVMLLRDWNKSGLNVVSTRRDDIPLSTSGNTDSPPIPFVEVGISKWPSDFTKKYLEERVTLHQAAREGNYPPCTDEERWAKPETWAVVKSGAKRAWRVFKSMEDAVVLAGKAKGYTVEHRPGKNVRCESYCPVARFCEQAKELGVVVA